MGIEIISADESHIFKTTDKPGSDIENSVYPWAYYLLGSNNEQFAVYHGIQFSDQMYSSVEDCNDIGQTDNPYSRTVFMYPVEYNSYGIGSSPIISYRRNENGIWKKHYNLYDYIGNVSMVMREGYNAGSFDIIGSYEYRAFGGLLDWGDDDDESQSRRHFIGKELDRESSLADHGVRKYDAETGRFTSTDALWEMYYRWSPYQYARNNPISRSDRSGLADYIDEKGVIFAKDEVADGRRIAVPQNVIVDNSFENDDGTTSYDFNSLELFGFVIPNPSVAEKILEDNKWTAYHQSYYLETAGVGNTTDYIHGGVGSRPNNASDAVLLAFKKAQSLEITPTYYVHKHPDGNLTPTNPGDYDAIIGLGLNYGILVGKVGVEVNVLLFRSNDEKMIISGKDFKGNIGK